ncbi:MAG: hypothetical protein ACW98X_24670, partial [Promethearchaeota archaeon]
TDCAFNSLTLKYYAVDFNFKKSWPIEAVGRYESDCYRRIYWSDYNNPFRALNLEAPNLNTLPVGLIDSFPDVEFTMPLLTNVLGGGALPVGTYQYAFRLITEDGKKTLISPGGNLIHCVKDSESLSQSARYTGEPGGINSQKAHEITINTSNYGDYEKIELISVFYADLNGTAEITSVEEKDLNGLNAITFLHTGQEDTIVVLENFEYSDTQYAFKTIKSLTPKDNSLIVANIKGGSFDIQSLLDPGETFDSEVIRYRSDLTPAANGFNIEYNKDAHWDENWHQNQQYKFQLNGTTLGGESTPSGLNPPNVTFKFHLEPFIIDGDLQPGFANLANIPVNLPNLNDGYNYANITYDSLTSPFLNGVLRGYKRGETYRFGIVFYNKKGEASFAEYIGDIKFPDLSEPDGIDNATGSPYWLISEETNRVDGAGVTTTAYALGIEFTLDFSSCPSVLDKIESYQIVRVKRNIEDKRRLCSGILKNFYEPKNIGDENSRGWDLKAPDGSQKVLHLYTYSPGKGSNANFDNLHDVPGESPGSNPTNFGHEWHAEIPLQGNYLTFHSPELSYEFDNEKALGSISPGSALLLMTGAYAQYYSDFPNSNFPVSGQPDKQLDAASTTWVDRYSLLRENTVNFASDDVLLGWNMDWKRKQRTTVPVLKDTPARSKEYVKLIKNSEKTTFRGPNSTGYDNDGASIVAERADNTFKFENRWLRNFYAGNPEGGAGAFWDLNDPGGASNWGSSIEYSEFSKGASGLMLFISPLEIDPLENIPLASQSQAPGFYIGDRYHQTDVTPWEDQEPLGVHPIPPTPGYLMWNDDNNAYEEIEAPNMFDYNQLRLSSRPLLDVVIPKQEIYGGFGKDALASNTFIPASPIIDKDLIVGNTHTFRVYGGDIFLSMWTIQEGTIYLQGERLGDADGAFYEYGATNQNYSVNNTITNCIVIESEINCGVDHGSTLARGVQFDVIGGPSGITDVRFRQENNNSISQYGTEDSTG